MGTTNSPSLASALTRLRDSLDGLRLPLQPLDERAAAISGAREIVSQLDDYVLPRVANIDAPLLAVVGGSTGAGKSTLVNSLLARVVTRPGVLRPTTKSPVLIFNPEDEHFFADERILTGLVRTRAAGDGAGLLQLVPEPSLPLGLALLDAPDIDSVVDANRELAAKLLAAADLWLFVTSAARYSDAVPWEFLTAAMQRSAAIAVVLDRVPPEAASVVPADLRRMMDEQGLDGAPLFVVPETVPDGSGLLPNESVVEIRTWLAGLAADAQVRQRVVLQTLSGAIDSSLQRSIPIVSAAQTQVNAANQLQNDAVAAYRETARTLSQQVSDGTLLRGEVLARWHDYVGTTSITRAIDEKVSWARDKIAGLFRSGPTPGVDVSAAASSGLEALLREAGDAAAERATAAWAAHPAGRQVLEGNAGLRRSSQTYQNAVSQAIHDWQNDVLELVADAGKDKRKAARIAALGINGVGAALMLLIFANTGGLTGAEVGVAGGTTVVAQRLLESIFGDASVRALAAQAREDLDERVQGMLAAELARFTAALEGLGLDVNAPARINRAIEKVRMALEAQEVSAELAAQASQLPYELGMGPDAVDPQLSSAEPQFEGEFETEFASQGVHRPDITEVVQVPLSTGADDGIYDAELVTDDEVDEAQASADPQVRDETQATDETDGGDAV
ncbi:MAG: ATP-binding protein [Propionibacteriaceae bacterium]|jgi:hypothetical protein|nr:ATP-binding protein [Propionibacteriaceae bacterium]